MSDSIDTRRWLRSHQRLGYSLAKSARSKRGITVSSPSRHCCRSLCRFRVCSARLVTEDGRESSEHIRPARLHAPECQPPHRRIEIEALVDELSRVPEPSETSRHVMVVLSAPAMTAVGTIWRGYPSVHLRAIVPAMRTIRRYANRKLYDTKESHYVTLTQIADMIRGGEEIRVTAKETGKDLTTATMAQIILDEVKSKQTLPAEGLRKIIVSGLPAE